MNTSPINKAYLDPFRQVVHVPTGGG